MTARTSRPDSSSHLVRHPLDRESDPPADLACSDCGAISSASTSVLEPDLDRDDSSRTVLGGRWIEGWFGDRPQRVFHNGLAGPSDTSFKYQPFQQDIITCSPSPIPLSTSRHGCNSEGYTSTLDRQLYRAYPLASPSEPSEAPAAFHIKVPAVYHSVIAGAGAGLISSVVTCPLDVIKTRLQASSRSSNVSPDTIRGTVRQIIQQNGFKGLYRGLGPTILGYLPNWGIYFSVYDAVKEHQAFKRRVENGGPGGNETWEVHIVAAMTAGATGTILTNPLWVIKTRFMAQAVSDSGDRRYAHTIDAARTIYRQEGLRAFYKGLAPSLIGVSHVAVQFPLYEQLKVWAASPDSAPLESQTILLCSALSKMVASLVTYPHEVLRTRLQIRKRQRQQALHQTSPASAAAVSANGQVQARALPQAPAQLLASTPAQLPIPKDPGLVGTFKDILHRDGWKGFYRGLSVNLMRTVPNSAVTMLT